MSEACQGGQIPADEPALRPYTVDLHGIDTETHTLLESLVESLPPGRFHLLLNYRCQEVAYLPFPCAFNSKLGVVIWGTQNMLKYNLQHGTFVNDKAVVADQESTGNRLARGGEFAVLYKHLGRDVGVAS